MRYFLLGLLLAAVACSEPVEECVPAVHVLAEGNAVTGTVTVQEDRVALMQASADGCTDRQWNYAWFWDADGNSVLDEAELLAPISSQPSLELLNCFADRGTHRLLVQAVEAGQTDPVTLKQDLLVEVVANLAPAQRPACYASAESAVLQAGEIKGAAAAEGLEDAAECLSGYLETRQCDLQASAILGLARMGAFAARLPERFAARSRYDTSWVEEIVRNEIDPIRASFRRIADKADDAFVMGVKGRFELYIFDDLPYLNGSQQLRVLLQGEHDRADFAIYTAIFEAAEAAVDLAMTYDGLAEFGLAIPRLDQVNFDWMRRELIAWLEADESFLTIKQEYAEISTPRYGDGFERLAAARGRLLDAIQYADAGFAAVSFESDPQGTDIVRYWDCGADGVCNCDDPEILLACPNEPDEWSGADDDGTEGNLAYDVGEPVGSDRIALTNFFALELPSNLDAFRRQLRTIGENIAGPAALDLDDLIGLPVAIGLDTMDIPYPSIRISQWFDAPSDIRDLVPAYSRSAADFIYDLEGEPFLDVGVDGRANAAEVTLHWPNPLGVTLGTGWDALENPDPAFDDLDPICNPNCTFDDGIDNDLDGVVDDKDRIVFEQFGISFRFPQELGLEGNLMFDWVDYDHNGLQSDGEPSEPYTDEGVTNWQGVHAGQGDGAYSFADRSHVYPYGADIGPNGGREQVDPANGTLRDQTVRLNLVGTDLDRQDFANYQGLYDPFYFFFDEPTFSGVLQFEQPVESLQGEILTENAVLQRFLNKLLEVGNLLTFGERAGDGEDAALLDLGGHDCAVAEKCDAAVEHIRGTPP